MYLGEEIRQNEREAAEAVELINYSLQMPSRAK